MTRPRAEAISSVLAVIIIIGALAYPFPTTSEVPPNPFYQVTKEMAGESVYLAYSGYKQSLTVEWTQDRAKAWSYGMRESAQHDADYYGGWVVQDVER